MASYRQVEAMIIHKGRWRAASDYAVHGQKIATLSPTDRSKVRTSVPIGTFALPIKAEVRVQKLVKRPQLSCHQ